VQLSTQALHILADRGIPVAFLSSAGRLVAMVDPLDSVSAATRRAQVRKFDDPAVCLALTSALVVAKIHNQRKLLMRNHAGLPPFLADRLLDQANLAEGASRGRVSAIEDSPRRRLVTSPESADSGPRAPFTDPGYAPAAIDALRGHEGQAAALYFEHFAGMLKADVAAEFQAHGRQRRPPPDPVNCCLSMAYSMLTHECTAALRTARLEPSIGAFHVSRPGRPALSLDLMEPFRPLIADSIAVTAFNRGELKEGHFQRTAAGCMFTDAGRKAFFAVYRRRMAEEVTHPVFGYKLSYRRMLILHARMIAAWLNDEIPTLSFLTTR
jgi:CRISPR-associated protein Cas1